MKKILFIILVMFITNLSVLSADYSNVETQKNIANSAPQTCQECRRVRKRFAKPLTRYARPKPPQKAGYYKTGMNIRYPKQIKEISYEELRELSYMGANVLHEETIFPVQEMNIPINIDFSNETATNINVNTGQNMNQNYQQNRLL